MAIEYWIRIENRPWDMSPHNIDRMTGQTLQQITTKAPEAVTLNSVVSGTAPRMVTMYNPIRDDAGAVTDALILRRYRPPLLADQSDAWTVPDDRKVNPWDLNEHNPGERGTMGTIPGPVIECNVGDSVLVHFKNGDARSGKNSQSRTHSLHPHGFVFHATSDGAYPLTPPDASQPVGAEAPLWAGIGMTGPNKQGDRVPPGGSFTYSWNTIGWGSTAGIWLYHDHSICDMDNVELGAIGFIVIHNPADTQNEVDIRDPADPNRLDPAHLPGGSPNGAPTQLVCRPLPFPFAVMRAQLASLGSVSDALHSHERAQLIDGHDEHEPEDLAKDTGPLRVSRAVKINNAIFEVDRGLALARRFCLSHYREPPTKALYLQLFHTVRNANTCINGRQWLGNTPTLIAGRNTRMRFGVVGMGSNMLHTFHIHGHRWIIPGPDGNTPGAIQGSPQVRPVSQFEDTRIFGPANSFGFTIQGQSGSFMRAGGPGPDEALGEWHMHCHVLSHMMSGMMGSLLVIKGGELAGGLPVGVPCPPDTGGSPAQGKEVHLTTAAAFSPKNLMINSGDTVTWKWDDGDTHTVTSDGSAWPNSGVKSGGPPFASFQHTFASPGVFPYHCQIHGGPGGAGMSGTVTVM